MSKRLIIESSHRNKFKSPSPPRYVSRLAFVNGQQVIQMWGGEENTHARNVAFVSRTAYLVAHSTRGLFGLETDRESGEKKLTVTPLGGALVSVLRLPLDTMAATFPECEFNPLFNIFRQASMQRMRARELLPLCDDVMGFVGPQAPSMHEQFTALVNDLRARRTTDEIAQALEPVRRRQDMQWRDAKQAVTEAFDGCAKLLAVHLDLHFLVREIGDEISKVDAMDCVRKFQRYLSSHFPLIRFMRCIEYGRESGFRFRFIVLLNAHLVANAAVQGAKMGEHWNIVITQGAGAYCFFNLPQRRGLGTIAYNDKERISALITQEVALVVKPNFWIHYVGQLKSFQISPKARRPLSPPQGRAHEIVRWASGGPSTFPR